MVQSTMEEDTEMERSKCCNAPLVEEKLTCCLDPDANPVYDVQVTVDVCANCGSIVYAHEAHMKKHESLRELILR